MRPITVSLALTLLALSTSLASAQTATPQWNPFTSNCENTPALDDPAGAQCGGRCFDLSAPRVVAGPTRPGEAVELGLWDRSLGLNSGSALARVIAPDETITTTTRAGYGPTWISLHYPTDFPGAGSPVTGIYTIVWGTRGLVVCDGFTVAPA
jgi:hypothetical protein